jgi:crossover junction endodeoxyribonuclease RusA
MRLELPWPPSVNRYWRHPTRGPLAGRHLISEDGRRYRTEVAALWMRDPQPLVLGRIAIDIEAAPPDRRRRDLDNILKGLLDALVHARIIVDDELIDDLRIRRLEPRAPGCVMLTIQPKDTA